MRLRHMAPLLRCASSACYLSPPLPLPSPSPRKVHGHRGCCGLPRRLPRRLPQRPRGGDAEQPGGTPGLVSLRRPTVPRPQGLPHLLKSQARPLQALQRVRQVRGAPRGAWLRCAALRCAVASTACGLPPRRCTSTPAPWPRPQVRGPRGPPLHLAQLVCGVRQHALVPGLLAGHSHSLLLWWVQWGPYERRSRDAAGAGQHSLPHGARGPPSLPLRLPYRAALRSRGGGLPGRGVGDGGAGRLGPDLPQHTHRWGACAGVPRVPSPPSAGARRVAGSCRRPPASSLLLAYPLCPLRRPAGLPD